jgi:hypothetical protein
MVERMVVLTFSLQCAWVIDDNSNSYRNMIINTMKMNLSYVGECPMIDEESYTDATMFFDLLKDSGKSL